MLAMKQKYQLEGARDSLEQFCDGFTIACKKTVNRVVLRRLMARLCARAGVKNVKILYGCDDASGGKNISSSIQWHICFNRELSKAQVAQMAIDLEEFRRSHQAGDPSIFLRWGIFNAGEYTAKHMYLDIQEIQ